MVDLELLAWPPGKDAAEGNVDVSFVFPDARVAVFNALDENGLDFDPRHRLTGRAAKR